MTCCICSNVVAVVFDCCVLENARNITSPTAIRREVVVTFSRPWSFLFFARGVVEDAEENITLKCVLPPLGREVVAMFHTVCRLLVSDIFITLGGVCAVTRSDDCDVITTGAMFVSAPSASLSLGRWSHNMFIWIWHALL